MAITPEQAAQLASTYQSGNTSGLQSLVSQMGVTSGDVAQYFPGFDVGSLQGITLAQAPTYGTDGFSGKQVSNFITKNINDPQAILDAAKQYNVSPQLSSGLDASYINPKNPQTYTKEQLNQYVDSKYPDPIVNNYIKNNYTDDELSMNLFMDSGGSWRDYMGFKNPSYRPSSDLDAVSDPKYGLIGVKESDIKNFISKNINNPQAILDAAKQFGLNAGDIQLATGYTPKQQSEYLSSFGIDPNQWAPKNLAVNQQEIVTWKNNLTGETETSIDGSWTPPSKDWSVASVKTNPLEKTETLKTASGLNSLSSNLQGTQLSSTPSYGVENRPTDEEIVNYVTKNLSDPTKIAQAAAEYNLSPEDFYQIYSGTQTPYSLDQIQSYLSQGQAGFDSRLQNLYKTAFGTPDYLTKFEQNKTSYEKALGLNPGALSSNITAKDFANTSLENIEKLLQESGANKYQEANNIYNFAKTVYGMSDNEAKSLATGLLKDDAVDTKAQEFYNKLLKSGMTGDIQEKMLMDAAVRAPNSEFWQNNPGLREIYTPIGELKSRPDGSGQYGVDPKTGIPLGSREAFDSMFKNGEVVRGNNQEFRQNIGQDKLGLDPHSAWMGRVAKGVGIFGVEAGQQEMSDFDRIEKEIQRLGGIKTETDAEGNQRQVVYKDVTDPETGRQIKQAVDVRSLFPYDEYTATDTYQKYRDTQDKLREAAAVLGVDTSQYSTTKQAYDDLNQKLEGKYLWQGRTNVLDPQTAANLGIDPNDKNKHATLLMQAAGDKVVPTQVLRTFDFQDPNTTRGFFGDIATGIGSIMSIPPIALAFGMAGGLPALLQGTLGTAAASTAASTLASSIGTSLGLEGAAAKLVGNALLNAGTSGLMTGLRTGDLEKAGLSALSGGIGAGVSGGLPMLLGDVAKEFSISPGALKLGSEIAGGAAARAVTGEDPGRYAINRLIGTGISALTSMGAEKAGIPTSGPKADLFKAMLPIIASRKVEPNDVVRLAQAVKAYESKQA